MVTTQLQSIVRAIYETEVIHASKSQVHLLDTRAEETKDKLQRIVN